MAPPWAAVVGAALVVLVAIGSVLLGLRGGGDADGVPVAARASSGSTPRPTGTITARASTPPAIAPSGTATSSRDLVVHVVGEVAHAGVVTVPAGARVADALEAAGGTTRKAVLSGLNLARPVVDGEQIFVPDSESAPVPIAAAPPPAPVTSAPMLVDLNTADQAALEALPGVGEKTAQKILEWRGMHGRFTSVDELGEVDGIGDKTLEKLRPHVKV